MNQIIIDLRSASPHIDGGAAVFDTRLTRTGRRRGGAILISIPEETADLLRNTPVVLIDLPVIGPQGQQFRLCRLQREGNRDWLVVRPQVDGNDEEFPQTPEPKLAA